MSRVHVHVDQVQTGHDSTGVNDCPVCVLHTDAALDTFLLRGAVKQNFEIEERVSDWPAKLLQPDDLGLEAGHPRHHLRLRLRILYGVQD